MTESKHTRCDKCGVDLNVVVRLERDKAALLAACRRLVISTDIAAESMLALGDDCRWYSAIPDHYRTAQVAARAAIAQAEEE